MSETVKESLDKAMNGSDQATVQKWLQHFAAYDKEFSKWERRVEKILKRYRDEQGQTDKRPAKFNILWSNIQTLIPATFSKIPQADVSRRFKDNDPVGRVASLILERAISYEMEHYTDFRETMKACVFDRFLGGRGTAWARYEPHILAVKTKLPTDGVQVTEDVDEPEEQLDYECAPVDYVHWKDFGHTVGRTWDEVTGVWRKVYMRDQAKIERFGKEIAAKIPKDKPPKELSQGDMAGEASDVSGSWVYEVWDKETKKAIWISKNMPEPIDIRDDPLGLEEFFPCPKPLFATMTNESLVPIPDFSMYQDQARELDTLADRMEGLIQALQVKGVYDAEVTALGRIFTEGSNGTLIPVKNWAAFAEKNGLAGAIDIVDLKPIYEALKACYEATQQVLKQIYDLTGLADIVRGQSNANETAAAQKIKGQYASLRLKYMQMDVAYFATQLIQLKAQIICAKFSPETIAKMAGVAQLSPADQALLVPAAELLLGKERLQDPTSDNSKNPMRDFRIEVNADTMVMMDEQEEKENRMEMLQATGGFLEKALPLAQQSPQMAAMAAMLLKFGMTAFKVGKTIEGEFDQIIDSLKEQAAQPQQPKPDPEMERIKSDQQTQQARIQSDAQTQQMKMQADQQAEAAKMQQEAQLEQMRQQMEAERHMRELQASGQNEQAKAQMQQDTELKKAALQVAGQIEVARINAKSQADVAEKQAQMDSETESVESDSAAQAGADAQAIMQQLLDTQTELLKTIAAPKQIVRDASGRAVGMQLVK